ncbi:catalase-like domain-containing protein [Dichotomocladium elegans]|nr:catalase-like domain-containing protein [Dichotomocladium elegans]
MRSRIVLILTVTLSLISQQIMSDANQVKALTEKLQASTVDDADKRETTNFGQRINNSDSLVAGDGGPALLEDFMLREKIMHFDHERIPERVVHARGVGAHGYFEPYKDWSHLTAAKFLQTPGKKTPVFVRFSTVLGSRGSPDTVRDVRGFATRFYTEEGLFDLVGNVIAPFFVQDAIKFPDLIHAAKPEPNTETPQAATAHETAYDFFAEFPQSLHTVFWVLSGRGIPTNFRQVEGFGVNTFRLINEQGQACFVKFHWKPRQGLCSLVWDEAQKIAGKDIDFHRKDLYRAIENGDYPEWEFGVQIIPEKDADNFDFDLTDPTKIVPESLVPVTKLGKMVLNRNVDNFFSETEQITFHPGHIVRGIGFSNDPLLQGRLFSYLDTQINRMNSANFMQIPINQPINPVHNNQRDGYMQQKIYKGEVSYYPNGLRKNAPELTDPENGGYIDYEEKVCGKKTRGKPKKFFDFYSQARLYYYSLSPVEQQQMIDGLRFEVGKSKTLDVRKRMIDIINHADNDLATRIAVAINVPPPAKIDSTESQAHCTTKGISMEEYPKPDHIKTKTVAILVAPGSDPSEVDAIYSYLKSEGAYPTIVGVKQGDNKKIDAEIAYIHTSSVLFDALFVPGGKEGIEAMKCDLQKFPYDEPQQFIIEAFRHCKPIGASGEASDFVRNAIAGKMVDDAGVITGASVDEIKDEFKKALIQQRFWSRYPLDKKEDYPHNDGAHTECTSI